MTRKAKDERTKRRMAELMQKRAEGTLSKFGEMLLSGMLYNGKIDMRAVLK